MPLSFWVDIPWPLLVGNFFLRIASLTILKAWHFFIAHFMLATCNGYKQKLLFSRLVNYMLVKISCKIFEVKFWHLIIMWFHDLIFNIFIIYLFWMRHIREQVEIISSLLPLYMSRNPIPGGMVGGKLLYPLTYLTSHPFLLSILHFPLPIK